MNEAFFGHSAETETADQRAARYFALGAASTRGMREWLGAPGSADPVSPETLVLAAADTVKYLQSRPAGAEDLPPPGAHYEATLPRPLVGKTARELVEEWAEAERRSDRTLANDITEALTGRALNRAATMRGRHSVDRLEFAAHNLNALYDRKRRIVKRGSTAQSAPQVLPPLAPAERPHFKAVGTAKPQPPRMPPAVAAPVSARQPERPLSPAPSRWKSPVLAAWVTLTNFFSHPEKGRRRALLTAAAAGAVALAGAGVAWLADIVADHNNLPPPSVKPPAPKSKFTEAFWDNLQPKNYSGQKYEWGAVADQLGAAGATPTLLEMVEDARAQGASVDVWGNPASGNWGVNDVTVRLADGTWKSYFDTRHKLAILQYLSRLHAEEDDL